MICLPYEQLRHAELMHCWSTILTAAHYQDELGLQTTEHVGEKHPKPSVLTVHPWCSRPLLYTGTDFHTGQSSDFYAGTGRDDWRIDWPL